MRFDEEEWPAIRLVNNQGESICYRYESNMLYPKWEWARRSLIELHGELQPIIDWPRFLNSFRRSGGEIILTESTEAFFNYVKRSDLTEHFQNATGMSICLRTEKNKPRRIVALFAPEYEKVAKWKEANPDSQHSSDLA